MRSLSLRQLSFLVSISFVVLFLAGLLLFKYFWSFDKDTKEVLRLQKLESQRILTVMNMSKSHFGAALEDYAAWDSIGSFIDTPNQAFINENMNQHTFNTKMLDGIFIFDSDVQLVWARRYDHEQRKSLPIGELKYKYGVLLIDALRSGSDEVRSFVRFLVVDGQPYILATSRVCNSEGYGCTKGYMMFIKKVRQSFISQVEQSTGIDIDIIVDEKGTAVLAEQPNVSYLRRDDYQNHPSFIIQVNHSVTVPRFIERDEVMALMVISILLFFFHLMIVQQLISPLKRAKKSLSEFKDNGGKLPDENSFLSSEMKRFASMINSLVSDLEHSRAELQWQSEHDPLTRVANRRKLEKSVSQLLSDPKGRKLALFLVDVDHFKLFNDNYGHLEGDSVLINVARALTQLDYGDDCVVARFGGEEFCIAMLLKDETEAARISELILKQVEELEISHSFSPTRNIITISLGCSVLKEPHHDDYHRLFRFADEALYNSKKLGRAQFTVNVS